MSSTRFVDTAGATREYDGLAWTPLKKLLLERVIAWLASDGWPCFNNLSYCFIKSWIVGAFPSLRKLTLRLLDMRRWQIHANMRWWRERRLKNHAIYDGQIKGAEILLCILKYVLSHYVGSHCLSLKSYKHTTEAVCHKLTYIYSGCWQSTTYVQLSHVVPNQYSQV